MAEEVAQAYVAARLAHPIEGPAFGPEDWEIAPCKPFELLARGNVIDAFASREGAEAALHARAAELAATRKKKRMRVGTTPEECASLFAIRERGETADMKGPRQ